MCPRRRATPSSACAAAHQFGECTRPTRNTATRTGQDRTRALAGRRWPRPATTAEYHEDDFVAHADSALSANHAQPGFRGRRALVQPQPERRRRRRASACPATFSPAPRRADSFGTEYNFRLSDVVTWTHGRNLVKYGVGIPHLGRRAYDDETNELGTYTFAPTLAADGVTVLANCLPELRRQSAFGLLAEYRRHPLHLSPAGDGRVYPGPDQGQQPLLDHSRPALRLAEFLWRPPPWLFAAPFVCVGARSGVKDDCARRRRHLLRPLRRRPAARSRALLQRAPALHRAFARPGFAAGVGLRADHQLRGARRAAAQSCSA